MSDFGPFSVDPAQVAGLGSANFGQFVNRLLAAETAVHNMAGTALVTTYKENVGDGGVDAGLRDAAGTRWIPAGDSAWQFKAGNLSPAKCKAELRGATGAQAILRAGGNYRLVLGATLASTKVAARKTALVEMAAELGIPNADARIEVLTADHLADWIEKYPALAVSPLLHGTGVIGQTLDEWSRSNRHMTTWISSEERDANIATLRNIVAGGIQLDVHIEGVSGLGKTRLVLETLRGQSCEPIVVYSPAADSFPVTVLSQLQAQKRTAVVVIDECDRKQHEIYAQTLSVGSSIRLVTIGEAGGAGTRTPMISLRPFGDEPMKQLIRANRPSLPAEAERVIVQVAAGNIDYALKLAQTLIDRGPSSVGPLITDDDLRTFFSAQLPDGDLFLASCALALFSRFGMDGKVAQELDAIANGLRLSVDDLQAAARTLQRQGLLSKQGRYRSVGPFPIAVYLAARGWEDLGQRIVSDLLPGLDPDLTERLFRRAADIGELNGSSPAMSAVLAADGPLASLDALCAGKNSALLGHFAVLAPGVVAGRLSQLIASASEDELRQRLSVRRDLVWALAKLAWHSRTFVVAADTLLRLAVAENESFSNNASGTWVELFGAMLPGTAAAPNERVRYLESRAVSDDARVRLLAAHGASRAVKIHESIMASAELQAGVVVEPRGCPATLDEVWAYRNSAIDILAGLATDSNGDVAKQACAYLVGAIHGFLQTKANREHLGRAIAMLPAEVVRQARVQVQQLRSLFDHVGTQDGRPDALVEFEALLPAETPVDRLSVLISTPSWTRQTDDLATELVEVARQVDATDPARALTQFLDTGTDVPAAYAVGRALQVLGLDYADGVDRLVPFARIPNGEALVGFLQSLVNEGDADAFDRFIDNAGLPASLALQYTSRGARTPAAAARVDRLVSEVSVAEAARCLFTWMHEADQVDSARYIREWGPRITSQADYNAAIDFAAMQVFNEPGVLPDLDPAIVELVRRRREFPDVRQEAWDWSVLLRRQFANDPVAVVHLLAELIEDGVLSAYSGSEEAQLLQEAVRVGGEEAWIDLMDRLERGEWRLSFSAQEWLGDAVPVAVARQWVGQSIERARALADVTKVGGVRLSETARYLIEEFGEDERVPSLLIGQFISGAWTGNESERIASQIAEVREWIAESGQSAEVGSWGSRLIAILEARRTSVLQNEEERDW